MSYLDNVLRLEYWQAQQLVALLNWVICCAIGWSCVCRISVTSKETTRSLTRIAYAALFTAATYSGWPPLRATWPGWPDVVMSTAVLLLLLDGAGRWRSGVPNDVRKERRKTPRSDPSMKDAIT